MKSILILFFLGVSLSVFSQGDFDKRLLAKFSEERIEELTKDHTAVIEYWTYYLDNSYIIIDGDATGKLLASGQSIRIKTLKDFNILNYDLHMDRNIRKTYDIKGTNSYLILLSNNEFSKAFSNQRK
ncbi:hypothetical protein G3O08_11475 [Cryomorpha ignava]|uniref:Uncharacterized protein n=1 Tax=Cryomorpha ignava TaxID=101383 RepID=A0A7K3WST5_9FLAO|nr:hypothetical protein [Cryomorpha ignava]NEN24121.1 hypothetical protein [Cryomorpha ignava]